MRNPMLPGSDEAGVEQKERVSIVDFKMVTFSLAGKDYAIDIMKVKEIAKAGHFTYVPNTLPFVLGVYNLRGDIIPIIDLRRFFNIEVPEREKDALENMLIVSVEDQPFGVVVDVIDKVVGIQESSIQPPHPLFGDINIKYIYGIVESNDRLYVLLDIDRIFGTKVFAYPEKRTQDLPSAEDRVPGNVSVATVAPVEKSTSQGMSSLEAVSSQSYVTEQKSVAEKESKPQGSGVLKEEESGASDADFGFIKDGLQRFKSFYTTEVNEDWVKRRFDEWVRKKGKDSYQISSEKDAEEFLEPFYSSHTGGFWSKEYSQSLYEALPANSAKQICVWNPGCGKGYEAYSLACVLRKKYPDARIKIYAQDIDLLSISNAPLLSVPNEIASSWYGPFLTQGVTGAYSFKPEIKEMILFEYHDCMHTNTMPVVDLVYCRDLISFLDPSVQKTLLNDFDEKLKGNGRVIVGENETLSHMANWSETMVGSVVIYGKQ
ncbi:MAG: CheR family methyltransferase [Candidatus Treponema excrementipullorum]|nr:chemotaxis protein CheW [Spirochaetia bacterium]MDD7013342.1 chemotaxis protein CheW [Candidatus Treponema excrementipullorum]MCI7589355.1 chemotaxis protein CheW [Spirochaetia bacterium]MDY2756909.1 CheR family methyltransferase [Candidatus Treponema excrementipullorum]MDY4465624.1 CheR family methyltransferase [Candidatus Treponema excrementipullorum]